MTRLSPRRQRIASGATVIPESARRKLLNDWKAEGFDVSEFVGILTERPKWRPLPPAQPVQVDVVVPFCNQDMKYVPDCIEALYAQRHADVRIHLINDGGPWPTIPTGPVIRYRTDGGWGPYRITNAVFRHLKREFIALNDADDPSLPDRLWTQVQMLRFYQAEMISSAMENVLELETDRPDLEERLRKEPLLIPGRHFPTTPHGTCINSTRMFRRQFFERMNGFADWFCGADFEFDNRTRYTQQRIVDDKEIHAIRRLRDNSLSNGGDYQLGTDKRRDIQEQIRIRQHQLIATPTLELARSMGDLDKAPPLSPLPAGMLY